MIIYDLIKLFNKTFYLDKTLDQIKSVLSREGILSGRTGFFESGHRPWNTGTKGVVKPNSGNFKKGQVPPNVKPLWDERICPKDGFVLMKIPEKNPYTGFSTRYKHKHVYVYERDHGPVPKGMVVAFKDSDKQNCEPDNLMCISRAELLRLNQQGYKDMPADIRPAVLAMTKLQVKTFEKSKSL